MKRAVTLGLVIAFAFTVGLLTGRETATPKKLYIQPDGSIYAPPGTAHATAGITAYPQYPSIAQGSIQTAEDFNRHVARVCPNAGLPTYRDGSLVPQTEMLRCITSASLEIAFPRTFQREAQKVPVTAPPPVPSKEEQWREQECSSRYNWVTRSQRGCFTRP